MSTKKSTKPTKPAAPAAKPLGKSIEEFRAAHDKSFIVPRRIKEALEKLGATWQTELEFAKLAGISITDLAAFRQQFEDFVVHVSRDGSRRVWAGTKGLAQKMREMVA